MDTTAINWLAVIVAAIIPFAIGFLWYGPLFGKPWMESVGLTPDAPNQMNMSKIFSLAFIFQLVMSSCLAMFFYGNPEAADTVTAVTGALYGFLTGFGWVTMAIATNSLFEQRSFKYVIITSGYWIVVFTLMGFILGVWK